MKGNGEDACCAVLCCGRNLAAEPTEGEREEEGRRREGEVALLSSFRLELGRLAGDGMGAGTA